GLLGAAQHSVLFEIEGVEHARTFVWSLASLCILLGVNGSMRLQELFRNAVFKFFGKLSYSIYLWHTPLLCSITSFVFLQTTSITTCLVVYFVTLIPISLLTFRYVDKPGIAFAGNMVEILFKSASQVLRIGKAKNISGI